MGEAVGARVARVEFQNRGTITYDVEISYNVI